MHGRRCWLAAALLGVLGGVGQLSAAPPCPHTVEAPEAPCRANRAHEVACWAIPSDTGHYIGYLVGGGCDNFRRGDGPDADEGTWGWDYRGWLMPRRVNLLWWHGRRHQGGTGAYKTDGPHFHPAEQEHANDH